MKCLILHCKKFSYKLDHPTPVADKEVEGKEAEFDNALVVLAAIEKGDKEEKINEAAEEIKTIIEKVNPGIVVINPFAHLSKSLAAPDLAKELSQKLADNLKDSTDKKIVYTSFGWYKSFMTDVYGHDNSQIFREF